MITFTRSSPGCRSALTGRFRSMPSGMTLGMTLDMVPSMAPKTSAPLENYMAPVCQNSRPGSWDYPWLLAKHPLKPSDQDRIKERLAAAMKEHPAWARELLIKEVPEKGRKERRDFWEELWLRDAAYLAGLITDTEYYFWLVEYLAVWDIYYKDNSIADAHLWLRGLLLRTGVAGIRNTGNGNAAENTENPENRQRARTAKT